MKEVGRDLSLISNQEAKKQGGKSDITENEAGEVSTVVLTTDLIINFYFSSFLDAAVLKLQYPCIYHQALDYKDCIII